MASSRKVVPALTVTIAPALTAMPFARLTVTPFPPMVSEPPETLIVPALVKEPSIVAVPVENVAEPELLTTNDCRDVVSPENVAALLTVSVVPSSAETFPESVSAALSP